MLGDNMNRFLDENWKDVTDELYPSLKEAVGAIVTSIARGLFSKIPFDDLFLPCNFVDVLLVAYELAHVRRQMSTRR